MRKNAILLSHLEAVVWSIICQFLASTDINLQNNAVFYIKCINYSNLLVDLINSLIAENMFEFSASDLPATPYRNLFVLSW